MFSLFFWCVKSFHGLRLKNVLYRSFDSLNISIGLTVLRFFEILNFAKKPIHSLAEKTCGAKLCFHRSIFFEKK